MIDPSNITNYNLTDAELEEHLLFWIAAAGKNGRTAARQLESLLSSITYNNLSPLTALRYYVGPYFQRLPFLLKEKGIGCYNNKAITFWQIMSSKLDLRTCTTDDLEQYYGIGSKTARCFILHSRKGARLSGLDTHMLKHLREMGVEDVPKSTPSSKKKYMILEQEVLRLADESGMSPADYDLEVWNKYSIK